MAASFQEVSPGVLLLLALETCRHDIDVPGRVPCTGLEAVRKLAWAAGEVYTTTPSLESGCGVMDLSL